MITSTFESDTTMLKSAQTNRGKDYMPSWPSWSLKEASEKTGYHREYIRWLLAEKKIEGEKVGNMWLVKIESLQEYIKQAKETGDSRYGPQSNK